MLFSLIAVVGHINLMADVSECYSPLCKTPNVWLLGKIVIYFTVKVLSVHPFSNLKP